MSFEPDSVEAEISELDLLQAILIELKKLNLYMAEFYGDEVKNEDLE